MVTEEEKRDVVDQVLAEHVGLKEAHNNYLSAPDGAHKEAAAYELIKRLVQHGGREEAVLYPFIRSKLPKGKEYIDRSVKAHQELNEAMYQLDGMDYSSAPRLFDAMLAHIMKELLEHIKEEEGTVLPDLRAHVSRQELMDLNKNFKSAIVTTRPHPSAPREGFMAAVAQALSVPLDKVRDSIRAATRKGGESPAELKPELEHTEIQGRGR